MRRAVIGIVAASAMSLAFGAGPAAATGGAYNVVKCHAWHPEADEIQEAGGHPSYGP